MKKILTADNTETFLNETIGESYHSQTGAVEEAYKKYVIPCKIKELAQIGNIKILDVCFGMGYNSAMAISSALEENPDCHIEVYGLEKDLEIIQKIQFIDKNIKVTILVGDSRTEVKKLNNNYFDAIFFDPFSPKTSPEMWSIELFQEMYRILKSTGILATYSCARIV